MSEFSLIERIRQRVNAQASKDREIAFGIGDDCASLKEQTGRELVITTDLLVEDIDFKLAYTPPAWLGHKALAVSLSDVAAMGAKPKYSLLTLAIPASLQQQDDFWDAFLDGYCALAESHQVSLIGGDISGMPERLAIDSVAMGHCVAGKALRRNQARVGDAIFVTGELGAAATGLQLLLAGERVNPSDDNWKQAAMRAQLRPEPRVAFGMWLGISQLANAMIDVSDGLAQDLHHICAASQVSAKLTAANLPIAPSAKLYAATSDEAMKLALNGGEDFELLFTGDPANENELQRMAASHAFSLTRIGTIQTHQPECPVWLESSGALCSLPPAGFDHFRV